MDTEEKETSIPIVIYAAWDQSSGGVVSDEEIMKFSEALEINSRIKDMLKEASYADRERIWDMIHKGLCMFCGGDEPCYCRRDD